MIPPFLLLYLLLERLQLGRKGLCISHDSEATCDELGFGKMFIQHHLRLLSPFFCVDLMDGLREIPSRDALKLRAEAS